MSEDFTAMSEKLCLIAKASTLQEIMDLSFQLLGNPVFVTDWDHNLLAYTRTQKVNDPFWEHLCQEQRVPDYFGGFSVDDCFYQNLNRERSLKNGAPVPIIGEEKSIGGLIKAMEQNGMPLGVLVVRSLFRAIRAEDENIMELISVFVGLKLAQASPRIGSPAVGQFLLQLLEQETISKEQIKEQSNAMKWAKQKHFCVFTVAYRREMLQRRSNKEIALLLSDSPYRKAVIHGLEVVCFLAYHNPILDWDEDPTGTREILDEIGLIAGASKWFTDLALFRKKYLLASKSLELGTVIKYGDTIYTFDEVSIYFQYELAEKQMPLKDFINQDIQRLQAYDNEKKGNSSPHCMRFWKPIEILPRQQNGCMCTPIQSDTGLGNVWNCCKTI